MLHVGDIVRVTQKAKEYGKNLTGRLGVVKRVYTDAKSVAVEIEGEYNHNSGYGYFWFQARGLERVEVCKEDDFMLDGYVVATVKNFENGVENNYACYDKSVAADDIVVVAVQGVYCVGKVVAVKEASEDCKPSGNREVVCKVCDDEYKDRKQREKEMRQLKAEMDKRVESLQAVALYELMAEKDPSLREMLEKFKHLSQGV